MAKKKKSFFGTLLKIGGLAAARALLLVHHAHIRLFLSAAGCQRQENGNCAKDTDQFFHFRTSITE